MHHTGLPLICTRLLCSCSEKPVKEDGSYPAATFTATHPDILARLPAHITAKLPVVFTRRGAIDKEMLSVLDHSIRHGGSFSAGADHIKECFIKRHGQAHLAYLRHLAARRQAGMQTHLAPAQAPAGSAGPPPQLQLSQQRQGTPEPFSRDGTYSGYLPTKQWLSTVWLDANRGRAQLAKRHMSTMGGRFLCMDHTFKCAKYIRDAQQQPQYKAVLTVMNEFSQIMAQWFTLTTSLEEAREGLVAISRRYKEGQVNRSAYLIWEMCSMSQSRAQT